VSSEPEPSVSDRHIFIVFIFLFQQTATINNEVDKTDINELLRIGKVEVEF